MRDIYVLGELLTAQSAKKGFIPSGRYVKSYTTVKERVFTYKKPEDRLTYDELQNIFDVESIVITGIDTVVDHDIISIFDPGMKPVQLSTEDRIKLMRKQRMQHAE